MMRRRPALVALFLVPSAALSAVLSAPLAAADAPPPPPKLLVLIAVDQMRHDYVDWYGEHWKAGLRRLYDKGAVFTNARYPYLSTVTCPGHATLSTGAYPRTHGMILNGWYDRERKKVVACTEDPSSPLVPHSDAKPSGGDSASKLMAPTLSDELQAQLSPAPRAVAISLKARSAISLGGHKPTLVLWNEAGSWVTAKAFADGPTEWVRRWMKENPVTPTLETPWIKVLPAAAYKFADDAREEKPPRRWDTSFPHEMKTSGSATSQGMWGSSPMADEAIGKLARAAVKELKLGQGPSTDFLGVSFSMTDVVGHSFGPRSHEVQDVLARLDTTIGALLDALDADVGADRYVVALSADHGVAMIPEQARAGGEDAGRISGTTLKVTANTAIEQDLGPGAHVADAQANDIYLAPGVMDRLRGRRGAIARVLAALRTVPGVTDAFAAPEIADVRKAKGPLRRAAALSYFPGRSGDLVIVPKAHWIVGSTVGTTHGTTHDYDQRVPVLFHGPGIRPGRYDRPASPGDIAPTLAALVGVKMKRAEGKVLPEIVSQARKPAKRAARTPRSARAAAAP